MDAKKILKLAALNIAIALINIALFSPGFFNLRIGGTNPLHSAIGGTVIFMSFVIFIYGNCKLILHKSSSLQIKQIMSPEDCILALRQADGKKLFSGDISVMLEQAESFWKKENKIRDVLLQKFNVIDTVFERFSGTINDVEYIFYTNIKSILNKIYAFDEEDYERIGSAANRQKFSSKYISSKLSIYNEYITYIKKAMSDNEEILLKLDALLLEISNIDCLEIGEIENMNEIKEIDELIKRSKYYI
ncbi:hypothetical protein LY28_02523 [Ruminiclostridium sufflavum DSM 19573]|uniref:Uncharacterized protein n=1 Tax=Ruminiclostridium sufflavum DSM 19573 TaxID=1121337 RepID=A0A318XKK4_9FIRM|nr:hypothetical protein [Ruminiclostridium sufflavum]PYG86903.1 hypothetical protein LY28_02523 [Ruminiclostridium sufflavum DSM 19573]